MKKTDKKTKALIEQREWILPCNTDYYDIDSALVNLKIIDWRQTTQLKNAQVGDIIYIYCKGKKTGEIVYKGAILEVNKTENIIDDSKYTYDGSITTGPCIEIAVFRVYELQGELTYAKLKEHGLLSRLQGPTVVNGNVADYLHECDEKQRQIDRFLGDIADCCCVPFPITVNEIGNKATKNAYNSKMKKIERPPYPTSPIKPFKRLTYKNTAYLGDIEIKIWIEDEEIHYSKKYIGAGKETIKDKISSMKKEMFIKEIEEINISEWRKKYYPDGLMMLDAPYWSVRYETEDGKNCRYTGCDEYPNNWEGFIKLLKNVVGDF